MQLFNRLLAGLAAALIALATGLGAWASHGLAGSLAPAALRSLETGINYQFFHALGLLVLALATSRTGASLTLRVGMGGVALGTLLFCGGVYSSSLGGPAAIAQVAPFGGTLLILGWLVVIVAVLAAEPQGRI